MAQAGCQTAMIRSLLFILLAASLLEALKKGGIFFV
jgi:hypothetical protein